jgi:hypothetical protein
MIEIEVEKITVNAPSRQLKTTWSAGPLITMRVVPPTRWQRFKNTIIGWFTKPEQEEKTK